MGLVKLLKYTIHFFQMVSNHENRIDGIDILRFTFTCASFVHPTTFADMSKCLLGNKIVTTCSVVV
jgi:hypothetical protein